MPTSTLREIVRPRSIQMPWGKKVVNFGDKWFDTLEGEMGLIYKLNPEIEAITRVAKLFPGYEDTSDVNRKLFWNSAGNYLFNGILALLPALS